MCQEPGQERVGIISRVYRVISNVMKADDYPPPSKEACDRYQSTGINRLPLACLPFSTFSLVGIIGNSAYNFHCPRTSIEGERYKETA